MTTSIDLSPEIEERLNHLAAQAGRSKLHYLRELIEQAIEDREDYESAQRVLARIQNGEEKVFSLEEVERELGLAD